VLALALLLPTRALAEPPAEPAAGARGPIDAADGPRDGEASPEPDTIVDTTVDPSADPGLTPFMTRASGAAPSEPALDPEARQRRNWAGCARHVQPCTRSRAARALLLALGLAGGAVSAGLLFGLGDRLVQADPATLLVGASALAGFGALAGAVAGRLGADGPARSDRVRPSTVSLAQSYTGPRFLDEVPAHGMLLRVAPNLYMPRDEARLRPFGHVGGWLVPVREVDPRPQFTEVPAGQAGTAPRVLEQRRLSIGAGVDLAVPLPYPVLPPRRSAWLGPTELRWKPEAQIRRDSFAPGTSQATTLSRTILLPLTVGLRWHLSARQRFTVYVGPRFDLVAFSDRGSDELRRGGAQIGPLYGEAWYDIDVPLTARPRRDGRPRKLEANGQLTLGYVHAKLDGKGFDFGPVIGFLGPLHVGWATRLRPAGAPVAAQLGAFARIGNGTTTVSLELGLVAPDLHLRGRRTR
jgi:hypothetical protein